MAKKAKKASSRKSGASGKRAAGKRDLVKAKSTMFAKRSSKGRFTEIDDAGKSMTADRRKKAKAKVKSGFGDRGDR